MKKIRLLLSYLLFPFIGFSQIIVPSTHKTIIMKLTADWCAPCGGWAWDVFDSLYNDYSAGKLLAIPLAIHSFADIDTMLRLGPFATPVFQCTEPKSGGSGIPSFSVDTVKMGMSFSPALEAKTDSMLSLTVEVNAGFAVTWSAASALVHVKTKFFRNASGTYYVGVYVFEDDIIGLQNRPGTGTDSFSLHHNVMRDSYGEDSSFGVRLHDTTFAAGYTFDTTFNLSFKSYWNTAKIKLFTVVWKMNPGTRITWGMKDVNDIASTTDIHQLSNEPIAGIYPNPATNVFMVTVGKPLGQCVISLYDITGKKVAELYNGNMGANTVALRFQRPANLANGIYVLHINSDKGSQTVKLTLQ
jgi:hypothetical protein